MRKKYIPIALGILFSVSSCAHKTQNSILGNWQSPTDNGGSLEFIENGKLVSHMEFTTNIMQEKFQPHLSEEDIKAIRPEMVSSDVEIPGSWKMINSSNIILNFEFSNETITVTNSIVQITDNQMIMSINGKNTVYTKVK
ncbi:hypothetical protein EGM51_09905 [Verrucomicrobia bacterium S94]|nr:hypothetical protein EGM51_09905 [Verrucomicrobia bacterium S94]